MVNETRSEAEIQADVYACLKLLGLDVRLEYSTPMGRLDVAIISDDGKRILAAVECKKHKILNFNTYQLKRYRSIGIPVATADPHTDIQSLAHTVCEASKWNGIPINDVKNLPRFKRKRRSKIPMVDEMINIKTNVYQW